MSSGKFDISIAIGGAAGQGIATPGNILARMFIRRGLHFNAYNAFQSIQKQLIKAGEPENPTVAIMIKRIEDINQNWQEAVAVLSESCPEVFTPESAAKVEHYFENQEFKAPTNWKGFWVQTK